VPGGEFGAFEGAAGFTLGEWFAAGSFGACGVGCLEVPGEQDGFGAAAGEAFASTGGEGVQEVLDQGVVGGWLVGFSAGAGERGAVDGECGGDGGQDAVAAMAEARGSGRLGAQPTEAGVAGCVGWCCAQGVFLPCSRRWPLFTPPSCGDSLPNVTGHRVAGAWFGVWCRLWVIWL